MTFEELALLQASEARQLIEENIEASPTDFALRHRQPALAGQLKYLQRSKAKLPYFFSSTGGHPALSL